MRTFTFLLLTVILSVSCTVGPNYKRPATVVPANFRAPDPLPPAQADSIADVKWFEVFKDEKLQDLVRRALQRNYNLRDAVARVEEARASLGSRARISIPTSAQAPPWKSIDSRAVDPLSPRTRTSYS